MYHGECVSLNQEDIDNLKNANKRWSCQNCLNKIKKVSIQTICDISTPKLTSRDQFDLQFILSQLNSKRVK